MKFKFSEEGNKQWDSIEEPETSGPLALSRLAGSASEIETAIDRVSKRISRMQAKRWSLIEQLRDVCPHDRGIGQFEGDDKCLRCGLIADTIQPNR